MVFFIRLHYKDEISDQKFGVANTKFLPTFPPSLTPESCLSPNAGLKRKSLDTLDDTELKIRKTDAANEPTPVNEEEKENQP